MKRKILVYLILLVIMSTSVLAIGVSPPKVTLDFEDGFERTFQFVVINNGGPSRVQVEVHGSDLAQYVTVENPEFDLPRGQTPMEVTLKFPNYEDLPNTYGRQIIRIRILETAFSSGAFAANTGVEPWIVVYVPVPGEYGVVDRINVPTVQAGETTEATVTIRNRGTERLVNKQGRVTILSVNEEVVDVLDLPPITVEPDETQDYTVTVPSQNYASAKYIAEASFIFNPENNPETRRTNFFVGSTDVQLLSYTQDLVEGEINEFEVQLQSLWSAPLEAVRGAIVDFEGENQDLPVIDFAPYQATTVKTFLDVPFLNESPFNTNTGENYSYQTTLELRFPTGETSEAFKEIPIDLTIVPQPVEEVESRFALSTTTILVAASVVVILLLVVIILVLLKKPSSKKNAKKKK